MTTLELVKKLDGLRKLFLEMIDKRVDEKLEGIAERLCGPKTQKMDKTAKVESTAKPKKSRRKGPIQLCPVPKCKNRAAPVFGMVCAQHKGIAKKTIAKYRAARRAKGGK
jgi:hypothetical protein